MSEVYVLDACALTALLKKEAGADEVFAIYKKAVAGEASLVMNKLNLLETYYDQYRSLGKLVADKTLDSIKKSPITIISEISDVVFAEAGRLKASYRISLADSVALAEASVLKGTLLTADHHELDAVEQKEHIKFRWIR
jgi:predicted nucleic acid-binding protein